MKQRHFFAHSKEGYIYTIYVAALQGQHFIVKKILMMDRMNDSSLEFHEEYSLQFERQDNRPRTHA